MNKLKLFGYRPPFLKISISARRADIVAEGWLAVLLVVATLGLLILTR